MKKTLLFVFLFSLHSLSLLAQSKKEEIPEVLVKYGVSLFESQGEKYLTILYENAEHWHTYWKNPGDAGLELQNEFKFSDEKVFPLELEWPTPKRYLEEGGLIAYGYSGKYALFYKLSEEIQKRMESSKLNIHSKWLICKHICIPGQAKINIGLQAGKLTTDRDENHVWPLSEIEEEFNDLPQEKPLPSYLDIYLTRASDGENLVLHYSLAQAPSSPIPTQRNLLTPFPTKPLGFKHEKLFQDNKGRIYGQMPADWDGIYQEPEEPLPPNGIFSPAKDFKWIFDDPISGEVYIVKKSIESFTLKGAESLKSFYAGLSPLDPKNPKVNSSSKNDDKSLWFYLLFAFLGGLILNFMPCVLPVISIKLFGLIKHQKENSTRIFKHNLFYTLGVLFCFSLLALVIVLLKSAGEQVGWGFQLQSPRFVAFIILVLFIFALNLFGLFEFKTPGGSSLGSVKLEEGFAGDFISGIIAVILSTPCSAPFLGTALTFAFSSSTAVILLVFLAIGMGLSFPFILTGLFPALVSFLPRPGAWMENLKKFLGLTLLLTIIWLIDVLTSQVNGTFPMMLIHGTLTLTFFGIYAYNKMTKNTFLRIIFLALPILMLGKFLTLDFTPTSLPDSSHLLQEKVKEGLPWKKWSPEKLEELKSQKKLVFMDFTAKWCFTCKVNEKLVLNTSGFEQLIEKYNLEILLADWTKRDPIITSWLKSKGKVGVPAYFVQKPDGSIIDLGETISLDEIEKALQ